MRDESGENLWLAIEMQAAYQIWLLHHSRAKNQLQQRARFAAEYQRLRTIYRDTLLWTRENQLASGASVWTAKDHKRERLCLEP